MFGVIYDGYLGNAEDDVEGVTPVIIKTVKGSVDCVEWCLYDYLIGVPTDNTPDIVVHSLLEGGSTLRHVSHRHLLPLLACHASDSEQPMLLFPKTALGTLKTVLLRTRDNKSTVGSSSLKGAMVSYPYSPQIHCPSRCFSLTGSKHSGSSDGGWTDLQGDVPPHQKGAHSQRPCCQEHLVSTSYTSHVCSTIYNRLYLEYLIH